MTSQSLCPFLPQSLDRAWAPSASLPARIHTPAPLLTLSAQHCSPKVTSAWAGTELAPKARTLPPTLSSPGCRSHHGFVTSGSGTQEGTVLLPSPRLAVRMSRRLPASALLRCLSIARSLEGEAAAWGLSRRSASCPRCCRQGTGGRCSRAEHPAEPRGSEPPAPYLGPPAGLGRAAAGSSPAPPMAPPESSGSCSGVLHGSAFPRTAPAGASSGRLRELRAQRSAAGEPGARGIPRDGAEPGWVTFPAAAAGPCTARSCCCLAGAGSN